METFKVLLLTMTNGLTIEQEFTVGFLWQQCLFERATILRDAYKVVQI
jgi:hypothetical protein